MRYSCLQISSIIARWRTESVSCLLAFFVLSLLIATPSRAQAGFNVTRNEWHAFFQELAVSKPTSGDTVRIYIDRAGDIYPSERSLLPDGSFATLKDKFTQGLYKQTLWSWYHAPEHKSQLKALSEFCNVPIQENAEPAVQWAEWLHIQDALAANIARYINQQANVVGGTPRPLVTLIHGYNNAPDARTFYAAEHSPLLTEKFPNAVWMEVRWDGLQKGAAWTAAQLNGRLAGAALREVLCRTSPAIPVRIFTHSAGGIVACHALWNASPLGPKEKQREEARTTFSHENPAKRLKLIPTPTNSDIRLGMMAPALTSLVFADYNKRTCGTPDAPRPNNAIDQLATYRVVIGQNMRDVVLQKFVDGPWILGDTGLGCKPEELKHAKDDCKCPLVRVELSTASDPVASLQQFQYRGPTLAIAKGRKGRLEVHPWNFYWQRPKAKEFVDKLME